MDPNMQNCCHDNKKPLFHVLFIVLIIFILVLIVFFIVGIQNKIKQGRYIGKDIETTNIISVSEKGEVYSKPDLAIIDLGVTTESITVGDAMNDNVKKMNNIIDFVKKQGIDEKDLKTTSFRIYPRYDYVSNSLYISGNRVLSGYEIQQNLQVKIRDIRNIGTIIEGAGELGANNIGDLSFTIDNEEGLKEQARTGAIEKAKAKAEKIASDLGVKLIRIISFSENSYTPMYDYGYGGGYEEVSSMKAPEIEAGENKISVTVSISYEIY